MKGVSLDRLMENVLSSWWELTTEIQDICSSLEKENNKILCEGLLFIIA